MVVLGSVRDGFSGIPMDNRSNTQNLNFVIFSYNFSECKWSLCYAILIVFVFGFCRLLWLTCRRQFIGEVSVRYMLLLLLHCCLWLVFDVRTEDRHLIFHLVPLPNPFMCKIDVTRVLILNWSELC